MFTWICQQCGRECQPSWTECPDCVKRATAPPPQAAVPPPPPPQPAQYPFAAPQAAPPPQYSYALPAPRQAIPAWLMTIVFALAFGGLVGGVYFAIEKMRAPKDGSVAAAPEAKAPAAGAVAKGPHPLLKHIEIVGIRITEDAKKKTQVRFVIVNHSGAEITDLSGSVNLIARTAKAGEAPVGTLALKTPSLGPYESKEVTAALDTNLRAYELPDWQNVSVQVEITSPQM